MKSYDGDGGANRDIDELERERNGGITDKELEQRQKRKAWNTRHSEQKDS